MLKKMVAAGLLAISTMSVVPMVYSPTIAYAKVDKKDKTKALQLYTAGVEEMKQGQIKNAAKLFMDASETDPENPLYAMFAGDMLFKLKQYPAAIRSYKNSLEFWEKGEKKQRDKIRKKTFLGISEAYRKNGELPSATSYARDLIDNYPDDYRGYLALGRIYAEDKSTYQQAITELNRSIDRKKDQLPAYVSLAVIYSKMDNIPKIIETYEKACDYRPLDENMKMALAQVYFTYKQDGNHYKDAARVLQSILDVNNANALAHYYLALAYTLDDDLTNAEKELGVLTGLNQNLADRLYQEIKAYNKKRANGEVDVTVRNAEDGEIITLDEKEKQTVSQVVERQLAKMETA